MELFYFIAGRKTPFAGRNILRQKQFPAGFQHTYCGPQPTLLAARNGSLRQLSGALLITAAPLPARKEPIPARKKGGADSIFSYIWMFLFLEPEQVFKDELLRF